MEALTSLPAELVALADPSARGAAPLLRPTGPPEDVGDAPASFDAFLALLAMPLPAGEGSPLPGRDLPVPPLATAPATDAASTLDADALETSATDAALLARLRLLGTVPAADPAAASARAALPPQTDAAQLPSAALEPPAGTVIADAAGALDWHAAAPRPAAEAVSVDATELVTDTSSAEPPDLPGWLDALAARNERPSRTAAATGDVRPSAVQSPAGVQVPAVVASQPAAEAVAAILRDVSRNHDVSKISPASGSALAESQGVSRPDWLPAAHAAATATSVPPAPASAGPPIDLRSHDWQGSFAERVHWLVDSNVDEARITLHPPELGAVDIDISLLDDKTYVQLTTATAAARDELSQSLPRLRELFAASGLTLGSASVHDGRAQHHGGDGEGAAARSPRQPAPLADLADVGPSLRTARPLGRIDVFA
jgi:flagellar hook-length control protein FliK